MKALLIAALFCFLNVSAFAQTRVIPFSDTTKLGIELDKLEKQYREPGRKGFAKAFEARYRKDEENFRQKVGRYFVRNKAGFYVLYQQCVNKNGKIDYLFYQIESPISDSLHAIFKEKLQEYANSYADTLKTASVSLSYNRLGIILKERKPTKGHTLVTVEEAQATTQPDTVKILKLGGLALEEVPAEIYRFANLEELFLEGNEIKTMNIDLARLPKLKMLYLGNNGLTDGSLSLIPNKTLQILNLQDNAFTDIPAVVRANKNLKSLWLGGNPLTNMRNGSFKKLRKLEDINFYKCGLKKLPKGIAKLRKLEIIDLYYNNLTELPKSMGRLKKLQQLAVSFNELKALPRQLDKLPDLHTIYAHHNRISQLSAGMGGLKSLQLLDVNHNWLSDFPMAVTKITLLQELDLSHNNLSELPTEIVQMRALKKLFVNGNPFLKDANLMSRNKPILKTLENNKTEVFY
ncbi:MAG: leucine-rich repeat domain-containing protein [Runella slithyformis]|nr:MAG: leucine-rich repeat domain-containing protein [Runella slithyformis]